MKEYVKCIPVAGEVSSSAPLPEMKLFGFVLETLHRSWKLRAESKAEVSFSKRKSFFLFHLLAKQEEWVQSIVPCGELLKESKQRKNVASSNQYEVC